MTRRLATAEAGFAEAFRELVESARESTVSVEADVAAVLARVREEGDAAIADFTARFDGHMLPNGAWAIAAAEIDAAIAGLDRELLAALDLAANRIEAFHRAQLPQGLDWRDEQGVRLGLRWRPLDRVGIYVPGGKAAYPSSVLMNAIPARVAEVGRIVMCVPCPSGLRNPLVLAAARRAGVDAVFPIGGAQAVGAMAFGTGRIEAVDRIVGPGNAYVAEAKRQISGRVGIDSVAGPSEVVVLADAACDPRLVAIDLLAQAEHDEAAQAILITDDAGFAERVMGAVAAELEHLPRRAIAGASWERQGAIVVVSSWDEAPALVDRLAPEHLEILLPDPEAMFARIRHAGAVFLGPLSPEALGDYVAGPNHVLPTARTARFASGLSVFDFLKRTSFISADAAALAAIGPAAVRLAEAEGLQAHAESLRRRLGAA